MEVRQLRYLVKIAESQSFSKAAARLRIAQPALSRQMSLLEAELRTSLLTRHAWGATPTETGIAFAKRAAQILDEIDKLKEDTIAGGALPTRRINISMPPSVALSILPPVTIEFRKTYPNILLSLHEGASGALYDWLFQGKTDIAVLFDVKAVTGLKVRPLAREHLRLILSAREPAPRKAAISLAAVAKLPLILPNSPYGLRATVDRAFLERGLRVRVIAETASFPVIKQLVAQQVGYSILPMTAVEAEIARRDLQSVPIVRSQISRTLVLALKKNAPLVAAHHHLIKLIDEQATKLIKVGVWAALRQEDAD